MAWRAAVTAGVIVACVAAVGQPARAEAAGPGVEGVGTATVDVVPQVLRLHLQVGAAGKDAKAALANLRARQEQVRSKLVELGAAAESIKFSRMKIVTERDDRQRMMQRMMAQRMGNGGPAGASQPAVGAPTKVTVLVRAEWPLKTADPVELLGMGADLAQKVKAQDLAGKKDAENLSAAEQEMLEESEGTSHFSVPGEESGEAEPVILYVAKVSKNDEATALARAFAKAKAQAEQTAKAAGRTIGGLLELRNSPAGSDMAHWMERMAGGPDGYRLAQQLAAVQEDDPEQVEAVGLEPGGLKHSAMVSATFALGAP